MATTHISEAEAVSDPSSVFARARAGEDIVVESNGATIRLIAEPPRRTLKETIARIRAHAEERGYAAVMDPDFADDLEEIIRNRKPRDTSAWD